MAAKLENYKDDIGESRWRLIHTNGQVIANYKANTNAMSGINSVKENAPDAAADDKTAVD